MVCNLSPEVQRWRSGESTRLPPMWLGFDSQTRRHMWVEFVDSLLCTERFSAPSGFLRFSPLLKNQNFDLICVNFLKGLGHAILGNFSIDQMVIELTEITK